MSFPDVLGVIGIIFAVVVVVLTLFGKRYPK